MSYKRLPYIFLLDFSPIENAKSLTDKDLSIYVYKFADLLFSAKLYIRGLNKFKILNQMIFKYKEDFFEEYFDEILDYPGFNIKHFRYKNLLYSRKFVKWIIQSNNNFNILVRYFVELLKEYQYRFEKEHKLQYLEEYFILCPLYPNEMPQPIDFSKFEGACNVIYKIPVEFRKKNFIESMRKWYMNKYNNISPLSLYSKEVPRWLEHLLK